MYAFRLHFIYFIFFDSFLTYFEQFSNSSSVCAKHCRLNGEYFGSGSWGQLHSDLVDVNDWWLSWDHSGGERCLNPTEKQQRCLRLITSSEAHAGCCSPCKSSNCVQSELCCLPADAGCCSRSWIRSLLWTTIRISSRLKRCRLTLRETSSSATAWPGRSAKRWRCALTPPAAIPATTMPGHTASGCCSTWPGAMSR